MKRMHITAEMNDGRVLEADTTSKDYLDFETASKRHKWGGISDAPALWEIYVGYRALNRTGQYPGRWEEFINDSANVDGQPLEVDPTKRDLGDDSL